MAAQKIALLFGKTGAGKSSLGNTILGKPGYFTAGDALGSVTNESSLKDGRTDDGSIVVFDTIGIGDTSLPEGRVIDSIAETVRKTRDGIDVMLFVMQYERITEIERQMFLFVVNHLFGPSVLNNMYVVFTRSPERLQGADVAERTAFLEQQARSPACLPFADIWGLMNRNAQRFLFVDNPDPQSTLKEALRPILQAQVEQTQRELHAIIRGWMAGRYQNSAMEAAREAHARFLAEAEAARQAELKAMADQIAQTKIDAAQAENEEERHRHEVELLKMQQEHERALLTAKHDADLAAERRLREELQRQAQEAAANRGGGGGGGGGRGGGGGFFGQILGPLLGGALTRCSIM